MRDRRDRTAGLDNEVAYKVIIIASVNRAFLFALFTVVVFLLFMYLYHIILQRPRVVGY